MRRVPQARRSRSCRWTGLRSLAAVLAAFLAGPALGDGKDPRQARRQLAAGVRPLATSATGITRDIGHIAVIEHDGSDYNWEDAAARAPVAQRFYESHGDNYDFLVVFTNFEFETGEALAFHNVVRNSVSGIGLPEIDNGPFFGAPGRLLGFVDMAAVSRYRTPPQSLRPGTLGFATTLNVLAHEVGHQWLSRVRYTDGAGQSSAALLGQRGSHWSYLLDSDASVMYGSDWTPRAAGGYSATRVRESYSALDLYLMGLLDPAKVAPFVLLRNPAIDATKLPVEGDVVLATPETISLGQVVAAEGPRSPSFLHSQKAFRVGFILLTSPGVEPEPADLQAVDLVRRAFPAHFFSLTRGIAIADTTLAEAPPLAQAPFPDLDRALAWLLARQGIDGRFGDSPLTAVRDSAAASEALLAAGVTGVSRERALAFLGGSAPASVDYQARRALALAPGLAEDARRQAAEALLESQNPDGGFGAARGFGSDALDTALALRALRALRWPADAAVRAGVVALSAQRAPAGGGWPAVPSGPASAVVTSHALHALLDWKDLPEASAATAAGLSALLARQNPDGGFGESPSTPYATALALLALVQAGADPGATDAAIAWLQREQLADGSWRGGRYPTALVLGALKGGVSPNLVVPAESIVLEPPVVQEGATVRVTARVANLGRSAAGASVARLFDGSPASGDLLGEAAVPELGAGESAEVAFEFSSQDRAGARTLYVLADAQDDVRESREDDNASPRTLQVQGLLPDLVVRAGDLQAAPVPAEEGESVGISVKVTNAGTKRAPPSRVWLFDGPPAAAGKLVGEAILGPLEPASAGVVAFSWDTTGAPGAHTLFAVADAGYAVHESDEGNNEAALQASVTGPLPPGPDLAIESLEIVPATLSTLPQEVELRAVVRNLGRDRAVSSVGFAATPEIEAEPEWVAVDVAPRSSQVVVVRATIATPGNRTFVATADPDEELVETNEGNNQGAALLLDPGDTLDIEVRPEDVELSASELVSGEELTVTARVRNRGTAPLRDVPVMLAVSEAEGPSELTRALVTLEPGAATIVELYWTASTVGEAVPLSVRADPFGLLQELNEDNNVVLTPVRVRASSLPDLVAMGGDTSFDPDPPREGASATILVRVRNPTPVAAGPFTVRAFLGDPADDEDAPLLGETQADGLDANGDVRVPVPWPNVDTRGTRGIFVVVDAEEEVDEYDEENNTGFRPFTIQGLPDLVLTAADVTLEPAFPRVGEAVAVSATVRNLGGQAANPTSVRIVEGQGPGAIVVGDVGIPALAPGASHSLELSWTPAAPPGERPFSLAVDLAGAVAEQNEGNNLARLTVVVQNADLFLSAPYFSPNGDGVRDETTLGYRATGEVSVVVSNSTGRLVRTLAEGAAAQGAVSWDGRDDQGALQPDGRYTLTLARPGGAVLGRVAAVLDTDRSPIHEAAGTGLIAVQQLTKDLPELYQIAWMPQEDELLALTRLTTGGFSFGIVRVALDGSFSYVTRDNWYQLARFAGEGAVSPDGREVLLTRDLFSGYDPNLYSLDLATGARRVIASQSWGASWSPDGRYLVAGDQVFRRDGVLVAELEEAFDHNFGWSWSPDGLFLAAGNRIVSWDGSVSRTIPLPDGLTSEDFNAAQTTWLGDGRIHTVIGSCGDGCYEPNAFLIDPATGSIEKHPLFSGQWSPDGTRVLYTLDLSAQDDYLDRTFVARQDGSGAFPLWDKQVRASPHASLAWYACGGCLEPGNYESEVFVLRNLLNLTAELRLERLRVGAGVLIRGTAADRHLDRFQLDYADQADPGTWRPIGAASDVPVLDDVMAVWAPPRAGSYLVRLRAYDRAGNLRTRVQAVSWDRTPVLAELTQDEFLISPTGDGVKDSVTFHYLVQEPTRVEVRISGPGEEGPVVKALGLQHPEIGAGSFVWDGRDASGAVVPDGRYTVSVNELPLRVDVDSTPPDIGFGVTGLMPEEGIGKCGTRPGETVGVLMGDRRWHVVDPNLKQWRFGPDGDTTPVFVPETDEDGQIVLENGAPRVRRSGGLAVDVSERIPFEYNFLAGEAPSFEAEDRAGNRSAIAVSIEEKVWLLEARESGCGELRIVPPVRRPGAVAKPYNLKGPVVDFAVASTVRASRVARLQYRSGDAWVDAPSFPVPAQGFHWSAELLGLVIPGRNYRGRFVADGANGLVASDEFEFRVCDEFLSMEVGQKEIPGSASAEYGVELTADIAEPLVSATLTVQTKYSLDGSARGFRRSVPLDLIDGATLRKTIVAPAASCSSAVLEFTAVAVGQSGRVYEHNGVCALLQKVMPECPEVLFIQQEFDYAASLAGTAHLEVWGLNAIEGARATLSRGPPAAVVAVAEFPVGITPPFCPDTYLCPLERVDMDANGLGEGTVAVRGRLDVPLGLGSSTSADVFIDRTPASVALLQPPEGGQLCPSPDPVTGRQLATLVVQAEDAGEAVEPELLQFRLEGGAWQPLAPRCQPADRECRGAFEGSLRRLKVGPAVGFGWDVTDIPDGEYTLHLQFADRAGNRTAVERHVLLFRAAPTLSRVSTVPEVFSPNGDGRFDSTKVTVRSYQPLRFEASIRSGSDAGPTVRTLAAGQSRAAGDHEFVWDGRDAAGQPVPDGPYVLVAQAVDGCGKTASLHAPLEVDATPPVVLIAKPTGGEPLAPSVDVRGAATDPRFAFYELSYGASPAPAEWLPILTQTSQVDGPLGFLGRWDTPAAPDVYTLRLLARDAVGNESTAAVVVNVGARRYLSRLAATPDLFSPNGDGRRDAASIEYELVTPGRVTLQVRTKEGAVLRTLLSGAERPAGPDGVSWDGSADGGGVAPDGEHVVFIHVEDPAGAAGHEDQAVTVVVDRTQPVITVEQPASGAHVSSASSVVGSIADLRLSSYVVLAAPAIGAAVELARGSQPRTSEILARLGRLADGRYTLAVSAEDSAENRSRAEVPVTVDSSAPTVRLTAPRPGPVRNGSPADVVGTVADENLQDWALSFGRGEAPGAFVEVSGSTVGGHDVRLGSWPGAGLPDGSYTLSLVARDKAGQTAEARAVVTLDGTTPVAAILQPAEGACLRAPADVVGAALDATLLSWTLEAAPGPAATAFQWSLIAEGTAEADEQLLARWPLAPDGEHTLRLTVIDRVGLKSTALRGVKVDTTPPAAPARLRAEVRRGDDGADVALSWDSGGAGLTYRVRRLDGEAPLAEGLAVPSFTDVALDDGSFEYQVFAVDCAGNESAPATVRVSVDLTPPIVAIASPAAGAFVAGQVDVRGTAFSAPDFKEYRLSVGTGAEPTTWTLLQRSTLPVAGGWLGQWIAAGGGPNVLLLEAEDTSGNVARATVAVVVDDQPPEAPTLLSVLRGVASDSLVVTWAGSDSDDVAGYIVERNGRVANAPGLVLGDLRAFLVPGPSHLDPSLPDGDHCYTVMAMDHAGNLSPRSDPERCESLDNRAPRATLVAPPAFLRFEHPIHVAAVTADLDVAAVQFQLRPAATGTWTDLGTADLGEPFETTLDPVALGLARGHVDLRAVATDREGKTDAAPEEVRVLYKARPAAVTGLQAYSDDGFVELWWSPSAEPGLTYVVLRDGEFVAEPAEPAFNDPFVALGTHLYEVFAFDPEDDSLSAPASVEVLVFALKLVAPFPVTTETTVTLTGFGAQPDGSVSIRREDETDIASAPTSGDAFRVEGVPLERGVNRLRAVGFHEGGESGSEPVVLISNEPPGAVSGLQVGLEGRDAIVTWQAAPEADAFGYVVERDGRRLTVSTLQTEAAEISASSEPSQAVAAFDGDPATAWIPATEESEWTVRFPESALVEKVVLRFDSSRPPLASYRIEALWEGESLPLFEALGNTSHVVEHPLPSAFATDLLVVRGFTGGWGLVEVEITALGAVRVPEVEFADEIAPDGPHTYRVATVDRYGAMGPFAAAALAVPVQAPAAPAGLAAAVNGRDVTLTWDAHPEPDVVRFAVFRDGVRLVETSAPQYVDAGLANGSYTYHVVAIDSAGQESGPSASATALVLFTPVAPGAPEIAFPAVAGMPVTLARTTTDVRGFADAGTLVSLDVNGRAVGEALAVACTEGYREVGKVEPSLVPADSYVSRDGSTLAFSWYDWRTESYQIEVVDLRDGARRDVTHPGASSYAGWPGPLSGDGTLLAYVVQSPDETTRTLYLLDVATGQRRAIPADGEPWEQAVSPDGRWLAYSTRISASTRLFLYDTASQTGRLALSTSPGGDLRWLRWSADSTRLLFIHQADYGTANELRALDAESNAVATIATDAWGSADLSPDGQRVAYARSDGQVVVRHLGTGAVAELGYGSEPRFDPSGRRVSFQDYVGGGLLLIVHDTSTGTRIEVPLASDFGASPYWTASDTLALGLGDRVAFFRACGSGVFEIPAVPLAPGENVLVARALDPATGLVSADSAPVVVTVPEATYPDLVASSLTVSPEVPLVSQPVQVAFEIRNLGGDALAVPLRLQAFGPDGALALQHATTLSSLGAGQATTVTATFTPSLPGAYAIAADVDPGDAVRELREDNNGASRSLTVAAAASLVATLRADRASYPAHAAVLGEVSLVNAGAGFAGTARVTVVSAAGAEVAVVDSRPVALDYGGSLLYTPVWNTGAVYAGDYALRLRVASDAGATTTAEWPFRIEPDLSLVARLVPERPQVNAGEAATFRARVENAGANVPLSGHALLFRVAGAAFETSVAVAALLPGGVFETAFTWPSAGPAGSYAAEIRLLAPDGAVRATAQAALNVSAPPAVVVGRLGLEPSHALAGAPVAAHVRLSNPGASPATVPFDVQVLAPGGSTVLTAAASSIDLQAGETRDAELALSTSALGAGAYPVFLKSSGRTLDRATLTVHAVLGAPSLHAPPDGAVVATARPMLVVNNATSPAGLTISYEFELYADADLRQRLPGSDPVPEAAPRTSWRVFAALAEDRTFYWRARASDGSYSSAWTPLASFSVDEQNLPPSSPSVDSPGPGATVATREPRLSVRNALDPELANLLYEFRLARDAGMTEIVASASGIAESFGVTSWTPPLTLDEDATYYWSARASDGVNGSPWTAAADFRVDSENAPPTAPTALRPVDERVLTLAPELVVGNASDLEGTPLVYRFEVDRVPSFDSPALQSSPAVPEGDPATSWTPAPLADDTRHYWRASAFDGHASGPWATAAFFVNVSNDPPSVPVPLAPADGELVATATPTLRVRNSVDPDGDPLVYDFVVNDATAAAVASASGVPAGALETAWTVDVPLTENGLYFWSARARDAESASDWSAPQAFRVNGVQEPPTAPSLWSPPDGATLHERRPSLTVVNASSPEGLALLYAFEVSREDPSGPVLVDSAASVPEGPGTTSFTPGVDLEDGSYAWRARAHDGVQAGPWMATARFLVAVDVPPAPPSGLTATPGDGRVALGWQASPEPDVVAYRVYRAPASGGPYALVGEPASPEFLDGGLVNGTTLYYVVTARDAGFESVYSSEVAATPAAPTAIAAEVRFSPSAVDGVCLYGPCEGRWHRHGHPRWPEARSWGAPGHDDHDDDDDDDPGEHCPLLLRATIELPAGDDPRTIDVRSVRLAGSLVPLWAERRLSDVDRDGVYERRLAFRFSDLAPLLATGANRLRVTGTAGGRRFEGEAVLEVRPLELSLKLTPETLDRSAHGGDVRAHLHLDDAPHGSDLDVASLRLQGSVPVERVVHLGRSKAIVEFDRAQVLAVLPNGSRVRVSVTGRLGRLAFVATDSIRVKD